MTRAPLSGVAQLVRTFQALYDAEKRRRGLLDFDDLEHGALRALEELVHEAGGVVAGKMAVLAEGDAQERPDITYLEKLPVFNPDGTIKA